MKSLVRVGLLVAWGALFPASPALAIPLGFVPVAATVMPGDSLDFAVVVSGTAAGSGPSVGAFDLDVSFDPAILSPTGVGFGPWLGDPALFEALTDFFFSVGVIDLAEISLLSPAELDALQPDSFVLATLSFEALGPGTSPLIFSEVLVDDAFGAKLAIEAGAGSVTVVPEPCTLALLGASLTGLGAWRRRRRVASGEPHEGTDGGQRSRPGGASRQGGGGPVARRMMHRLR
jgi:hypothetical protein